MRNIRAVILFVLLIALIVPMMVVPAGAQDDAPPVLVYPVNQANFLPGVGFDFHVEVWADALPEDFSVTVNGEAADAFFGEEWDISSFEFGDEEAPTTAQKARMNGLSFDAAGEYTVEVVAGGETRTYNWTVREPVLEGGAQNVVLFIADGGSIAVYTAARLLSQGMDEGVYGGNLSFEDFEEIGFLHTSGIDSIITDSANSASSYNTGHKSAVNANGVYPDSTPDPLDDPRTEKLAYVLDRYGYAVGIVTDSDFTDATPNGVWGYGRLRSSSARAAYAAQILDEGLLPEVLLGGGARYLLPQSADGSARGDDRDLFAEYEAAGYTIVTTATELSDAMAETPSMLVGMFHPSDMNVWLDRNVFTDNVADFPDQPGMVEMTLAALDVLSQNETGFYLQVESASIDKQLHPMDFERALANTIEFDQAIAATVEWVEANAPDTLIIVTSDHAHSYDVFGTVDTVAFNEAEDINGQRNAIGIYNDAGFPTYVDEDGDGFPDDWNTEIVLAQGKVENPPFTEDFQVSETPRSPSTRTEDGISVDNPDDDPNGLPLGGNLTAGSTSSVHTLQSVPVYAHGPGSECLGRTQENTEVFFCIMGALGVDATAE